MRVPKYPVQRAVARTGVNYFRSIVEASNSIFIEIPQESDIGIVAIIELIEKERPTNKSIAAQIKSGDSYYNENNDECSLPVGNHADYWLRYPLPVYGLVYVPSKNCGYWVDIRSYLKRNPTAVSITFRCTKVSAFTQQTFQQVFSPRITGTLPTDLPFEEALSLFHSANSDESYLGMHVLFRLHSDRNLVWDEFISYFKDRRSDDIPGIFAYYLAHIPWHGDIWGGRDKITAESREYAKSLIQKFNRADIIKLLELIDEQGIARGTVGQSVEALIASVTSAKQHLLSIIHDVGLTWSTREWALVIYAYHNQATAEEVLETIKTLSKFSAHSEYISYILTELKRSHGVFLY
jgi:hypothetical protein